MIAVLDSNVVIGAFSSSDQYAAPAKAILDAFSAGTINTLLTTNYALVETVNFLLRKASHDAAMRALRFLTETEGITLVFVDRIMQARINEYFSRYKELSITDCSLIAIADEHDVRTVFSFDAGFDRVRGITRSTKV